MRLPSRMRFSESTRSALHNATPLLFLMRHGGFRQEALGCLHLGLRHGAYCIGCCWVLMALLFVGGVMNVLWIALLFSIRSLDCACFRHCFSRGRNVVAISENDIT